MDYFGNYPMQFQPNGMNMYGGYPVGYPPNYIPNQQGWQTTSPGYGYDTGFGDVMNAPTGGVTTVQGGYNPVNGVTTYPQQMQGVPQPSLHQNPYQVYGYAPSPGYMSYGVNPYYNNGFGGYMTPYGNPNGAYIPGIPQNQYNAATINELLYTTDPNVTEFVKDGFRTVIFSEEEIDKYRKSVNAQQIIGYDYYGRPIYSNNSFFYNNYYEENKRRQEELEKARQDIIRLGVDFSRAVHSYYGENFNQDQATAFYDPYRQNMPNFEKLSKEEIEYQNKARDYYRLDGITYYIDAYNKQQEMINQEKARCFNMIKESHDRLLGIEPDKEYTLNDFLKNGYKLMVNIAKQKLVNQMRNGQNKYNSVAYRQGMAAATNMPIPMPSTIDDEYIPIEEKLKNMYTRNKIAALTNMIQLPDGTFTHMPPPPELVEENKRKDRFMNAVNEMAEKDKAKRGWGA